jgi:Tol biopolymer transport system component
MSASLKKNTQDSLDLPLPKTEVLQELERVLRHRFFENAAQLSRLLQYLVDQSLQSASGDIKEYSIGLDVFGREPSFDPRLDSVVRVNTTRLRTKLTAYYAGDGQQDPVIIELPRGNYHLVFRRQPSPEPVPGTPPAAEANFPRRKPWQVILILSSLVLLVSAATVVRFRTPWAVPAPPRSFLSSPGLKRTPAFSPDGQSIAFEWAPEGQSGPDLYVQRLDEDTPTRLTSTDEAEIGAAWSPDGVQIAFFRLHRNGRMSLLSVPAKSGPEQSWAEVGFRPTMDIATLDWTPDGRYFVTVDQPGAVSTTAVVLISLETKQKYFVTAPPAGTLGDGPAAVSPDGRWIAFRRTSSASLDDLFLIPFPDPKANSGVEKGLRRLTSDSRDIQGLAWDSDGKSLIVSSQRAGARPSLYRVPVDGGSITRLPGPGLDARMPAVARKGGRLAWIAETVDESLWRVSTTPGSSPVRLLAASGRNTEPQYSPDGSRIAFRSDRNGSDEIWSADSEGGNLRRLTSFRGPLTGSPRWSPDGLQLVFETRAANKGVLCHARLGSAPDCIDDPGGTAGVPSWSHDGRWIYFGSSRSGRVQVWKRAAAGGSPVQLTHGGGFQPFESPDGAFIYYSRGQNGHGIWRIPAAGGEETAVLPDVPVELWGDWAIAAGGVYYAEARPDGKYAIWHYDPATKTKRLVCPINGLPVPFDSGLTVSSDERWLLYARADRAGSEVMLLEDLR